jgi:hypothetical protein
MGCDKAGDILIVRRIADVDIGCGGDVIAGQDHHDRATQGVVTGCCNFACLWCLGQRAVEACTLGGSTTGREGTVMATGLCADDWATTLVQSEERDSGRLGANLLCGQCQLGNSKSKGSSPFFRLTEFMNLNGQSDVLFRQKAFQPCAFPPKEIQTRCNNPTELQFEFSCPSIPLHHLAKARL